MQDNKYFEIQSESSIIRSIVSPRYGLKVQAIEVQIRSGGEYVLNLYDGLEGPKLIKSIDRPHDGDIIPVNEVLEHELAYQLKSQNPESIPERGFFPMIVYQEIPPTSRLGYLE
jgi:hypothetical protein